MNKPVRVVLLGEADNAFKKLNEIVGMQIKSGKENTEEMQLLKSIRQKIDFVKANPFYGDPVAKNLIPPEYKEKYAAINLFRVELSGFWKCSILLKGIRLKLLPLS